MTNEKVRNHIHDDIAFSILSKLPLKSLKRFEYVRKSWSQLLENPQFMSMSATISYLIRILVMTKHLS